MLADPRRRVRSDLDLLFHLWLCRVLLAHWKPWALRREPIRCTAQSWRQRLQTAPEDTSPVLAGLSGSASQTALSLFDASLDRLAHVAALEPLEQVGGDRFTAKVNKRGVLLGITDSEAL